jgi:hypothetical protein
MNASTICRIGIACLLLVTCSGFAQPPKPADLVLHNGAFVTLDKSRPRAQALASRGGRIVAVGTNDDVKRWIGPKTRVIDLKGRPAYPGFIEGHGHFLSLGRSLMSLDLKSARNWDDVVAKVKAAVARSRRGEWIVGRGWHQEKWTPKPKEHVDGYPVHGDLSRVSPHNPVLLVHATGHASFANARAMHLAGVDRDTPNPQGGLILKNKRGEPSGVFRETAQSLVRRAYSRAQSARPAKQRADDDRKAFELAARECLSKGITSFQDAGSSFADVDLFKKLVVGDRPAPRLWVMLNESNSRLRERMKAYRMIGYGGNRLTVRAIKRMADGALGAHGALFLKPYADLPSTSGLRVQSLAAIEETAVLAARHDYQLCVHAIGDRANREILDLFRVAFRSHPDRKDWRWRIEHAQHLHPRDIPRFAELKVIASMQANHATSDGPFVVRRLGRERARSGAYVWRSLIDAGATVINGTDAPVEDVNPILSFHASVTRQMKNGKRFFPEQCMTRREAIRSYTVDAARAAFEETLKGTLTPGKLADVVVLSADILTISAAEIPKVKVAYTVVGGRVAYSK